MARSGDDGRRGLRALPLPDYEAVMQPRYYRLMVILGAISWFMLGMHMPMLHDFTSHGSGHWGLLIAMLALAVMGVTSLWNLLRTSPPHS